MLHPMNSVTAVNWHGVEVKRTFGAENCLAYRGWYLKNYVGSSSLWTDIVHV